jgi:hypothetical protein
MRKKVFGSRPVSRPVSEKRQAQNRPDYVDRIPRRVLFSVQGSTGWHRRRDLRGHKGNMKEGDFSHLHHKFADPEDSA